MNSFLSGIHIGKIDSDNWDWKDYFFWYADIYHKTGSQASLFGMMRAGD